LNYQNNVECFKCW